MSMSSTPRNPLDNPPPTWTPNPKPNPIPTPIVLIAVALTLTLAAPSAALRARAQDDANPPADPPVAELIRGLGADRYSDRERATAALDELGDRALPELVRALKTENDPETLNRLRALVETIEARGMARPVLVRLDFQDVEVAKVVETLNADIPLKLTLNPPDDPAWKRRVTLVESEPVSFWVAFRKLAEAANAAAYYQNFGAGPRRGNIMLTHAGTPPNPEIPPDLPEDYAPRIESSDGPALLLLTNINANQNVQLSNGLNAVPSPAVSSSFNVNMQIYSDGKVLLSLDGQPEVEEAVDENGLSLMPPAKPNQYGGYMAAQYTLNAGIPLNRPKTAGKLVKRIRGRVPLVYSSRRAEFLEIPLPPADKPLEKPISHENDDVALVIENLENMPGQGLSIEVEIQLKKPEDRPQSRGYSLHSMLQSQIEIVDAKGAPAAWYLRQGQTNANTGSARATLQIQENNPVPGNEKPAGPPAVLRYYPLRHVNKDVEFEFRDILLP